MAKPGPGEVRWATCRIPKVCWFQIYFYFCSATTPWDAMSKETAYNICIENKRRSLKRVSFRMNETSSPLKTRQKCSETLLWSYIDCITSIRENPIIWYIKWKLRLFSSWWWSENDVLRKCKFLIYITRYFDKMICMVHWLVALNNCGW